MEESFSPVRYLVTAFLSVSIYLPMIAWLSAWIGLWVRSQTRAMIGSLAAILGWCLLPILCLIPIVEILNLSAEAGWAYLLVLSPMLIVPMNESNEFQEFPGDPWSVVALNFVLYGLCLVLLRGLCLRSADRIAGHHRAR
jgi:hypothetical protein